MADASHQARSPPAADEETQEVRGAEHPDVLLGKVQLQPGQGIERTNAARGELQEDD